MEAAFDQQSITALIVGASAKLDVLWQIFIALHFGVFTLLLFNKAEVRVLGRIIALVGYLFMLTINYGALQSTYKNLDGLHHQFRKDFADPPSKFAPALRKTFLEADFSSRQMWLYGTHGSAFLLVTLIIFGRRWLIADHPPQDQT